jgi:Tfp pilus assembly protein PilF
MVLDRQGLPVLARGHFERAVRLSPTYADARSNFGLHLARHGDWIRAREQLREAAQLAPSPGTFTNLGTVLARMGDSAGALDHYRRALALDESFETARLNLARTLIEAGRRGEAVAHLRALTDSKAADVRTAARELLKIADGP